MNHVTAEIITIGDEILYGHILDTNSQWMCQTLDAIGVKVIYRVTIGDNETDILNAFSMARERADIILITGGLGPTEDDLTKPCLAKFFDSPMEINDEALAEVTSFFKSRGRELSEINRQQALIPIKAVKLTNKMGTAPGIMFYEEGKMFVSMPGVPIEMKHIVETSVLPKIREYYSLPVIVHKIVKTIGIGESFLAEKIKKWADSLPSNISLAYLPSLGMVKLRLTAVGDNKDALFMVIDSCITSLKLIVGKYIFGYDDDTIEGRIGSILREKGLSLSAAESCTGGYFSHLITSVPGSSTYFMGSIISYDNAVKANQLNIDSTLIEELGAVSEEVVIAMAQNIRDQLGTDIGIAVSGIAGPDGGSEDKPLGTVWICFSDGQNSVAKKLNLGYRGRKENIHLSSLAMLNLLRLQLSDGIRE